MKSSIALLLMTLFLLSSFSLKAEQVKIYSAEGYPYKLLINRTNTVKIYYHEDGEAVNCRTEIQWGKAQVKTSAMQVSSKKFASKPLLSCLPREQAKAVLASTFN